jgi:hypothetical protein
MAELQDGRIAELIAGITTRQQMPGIAGFDLFRPNPAILTFCNPATSS